MFYNNSTTPSYRGVYQGQFSPMPSSPNAVSTQTDQDEKRVEPISYTDIETAKKKVKKVLAQLTGNEIQSEDAFYMHVVFTTNTMKYNDDVELYFDESKKQIHYRSQSRVGYSDRGLNRERYNQFMALYSGLK